jgi:hypothetical protein
MAGQGSALFFEILQTSGRLSGRSGQAVFHARKAGFCLKKPFKLRLIKVN